MNNQLLEAIKAIPNPTDQQKELYHNASKAVFLDVLRKDGGTDDMSESERECMRIGIALGLHYSPSLSYNQSHTEPEGKQEPEAYKSRKTDQIIPVSDYKELKMYLGISENYYPLYAHHASQQIATNENAVEIGESEDLLSDFKASLDDTWNAAKPRTPSSRALAMPLVLLAEKHAEDKAKALMKWCWENRVVVFDVDDNTFRIHGSGKIYTWKELYSRFLNPEDHG